MLASTACLSSCKTGEKLDITRRAADIVTRVQVDRGPDLKSNQVRESSPLRVGFIVDAALIGVLLA